MKGVWSGASSSPNTGATYYQHLCATLSYSWNQFENATNGFQGRTVILTEDVVITKLTLWVGTAPGGAASWTFRIRSNAANTAALLVISGTNTTGVWTGELNLSAGDAICLSATPASTPASAVNSYWTVEYSTNGEYYLLLSAGDSPSSGTGTYYYQPFGGNGSPTATSTSTDLEAVIPTSLTATKISTIVDQNVSATYTYYVRNNTSATDSSFSAVVTTFTGTSSAGSLSFSPGDMMVIKEVRSGGGAWGNIRCCITVVPGYGGEVVQAYGNTVSPSNSATNYNQPLGAGNTAWSATESSVAMRLPATALKKLYVKLGTAPGSGKSRSFNLRSNSGDSPIVCSISDSATTGNDTGHVYVHNTGNFISIKTVPSATPASTSVKVGFVMVISQSSVQNQWFSNFMQGY